MEDAPRELRIPGKLLYSQDPGQPVPAPAAMPSGGLKKCSLVPTTDNND
ncbi:MAG: hypothetical protein KME56_07590 [Candidatus Thiodiazotropha sp. (ex Ctena orbiculata)]|uniref:Uncharacterized protein n=1 Tax=Candidatus Thiodiazotropha taylori TaxID=2792791 RepID=A0A944QTA5_9GAMM|nr:hypothetical protein [Candidatus Thiodiazotropha taylori]MBT2988877.1 hypothetical protein [Candidatus Thiodiazotropha taylori]MBT2996477.1 hypothetical protein [Candidatus Thiodiazotropha taylori]MBT3000089.1 hypothetical protein [Candidatus Thiodiazotropha taylori]MBT3028313.1 hypothetical protein [Candidatus Thiodiazotropha taylori]